jgi:glutamate synthase domain-containing protein 2
MNMRRLFIVLATAVVAFLCGMGWVYPPILWLFVLVVPAVGLGIYDMIQIKHSVRRNFPLLGHGRYLLEKIRPEINQYFVESNSDGKPFSREERSVVYQRAKKELDTLPFGTQRDVYAVGYEWINHSLAPVVPDESGKRIWVGGKDCRQPYHASIFNVSAMSYGSLSQNAIRALNQGAKLGGFAHNTGEGGLSPYHLENGGDIIWQIGTGYFGCRDKKGGFSIEEFTRRATLPVVKMIEIKLSQGAKPGHGGILPASKLTPEIAEIRGVPLGEDVVSPPAHTTFSTPVGLLEFVQLLREKSGGKPVGFKLCIGKRREFLAIVKAMLETKILPDFITVDGGEGGTGAAPLEFSDHLGTPLNDGLSFVHSSLMGAGLRPQIRIIAAGKVNSGFKIAAKVALGADMCNAARAMMFALGCIQALRCNSNVCPTGVATQDPDLVKGLHVGDKSKRVANFHHETVRSFFDVIGAAGIARPRDLRPWHVMRRISPTEVRNYSEIYPFLEECALLGRNIPDEFARAWNAASPSQFGDVHVEPVRAQAEEASALP